MELSITILSFKSRNADVAFFIVMLSVIMLNVVMLSVVAPSKQPNLKLKSQAFSL
jgi:uncharacterized membrane protein affecting hemolysin expression